ncbi:pyridoxamine 5'-phosphate oxidase family protein [Clostridium vincentii]|uniref:Pyridoxamine 5'-phosphate oxidase n=1 Tax=Clostridium vincentii TaxID=52704 RepID=A0A2T0BHZ1_9CLOT|nr:pyridoxamine 5'-phosphate oxidase family protein [Clostridium vincentii]PRR83422.1 Pyridoxamine 5'-phosphate oxidase [Clostridium vincentii]
MEDILEFLSSNPVFYFATVDGDEPKIRPFGFHMEYEGKLYFGIDSQKETYKQLKVNSKFEVCTASRDGNWIRIKAEAIFDERAQVLEKAFENTPSLKEIYTKKNGPRFILFYASKGSALIEDMSGNKEVYSISE